MGTRSGIAVEVEPGKSKKIYCHWDGYLSHNGKILLTHYDTREKVMRLVDQGNLSVLDESPEKPVGVRHGFDKRAEGYCLFYGRDRGETGCEAEAVETWDTNTDMDQEYLYQFINGEWWYSAYRTNWEWKKLTKEEIDKEED